MAPIYCTYCGRKMIPAGASGRYPQYEWVECPRARMRWCFLGQYNKHDVKILRNARLNYDSDTGQKLG